jgi:hypothetical protein
MKSQPDITIRRIAVFTGYTDSAAEPAFTRPIRRPLRPAGVAPVTGLEAVPALNLAELPQAA